MVTLEMTDHLAGIVYMALIVESEGPRSDDRTAEEIALIETLITNIKEQIDAR